jgi:RHS repeat-associated protein
MIALVLTIDGVTKSYSYDASDRLIAMTSPTRTESYTLLGDGARLSATINGVTQSYSYDSADGLQSNGYVTDADGRVTMRNSVPLVWDAANRLLSMGINNYTYDAQNQRLTAPNHEWTWGLGMEEVDGDSVVTGMNTVLSTGSQVYGHDALGSILNGNDYGPFGDNPNEGIGFTGHWNDDTGLVYAQQRWLDPVTGRFLSEDPVAGNVMSPMSMQGHTYANSNPTRFIDPDGQQSFDPMSYTVSQFNQVERSVTKFGVAALEGYRSGLLAVGVCSYVPTLCATVAAAGTVTSGASMVVTLEHQGFMVADVVAGEGSAADVLEVTKLVASALFVLVGPAAAAERMLIRAMGPVSTATTVVSPVVTKWSVGTAQRQLISEVSQADIVATTWSYGGGPSVEGPAAFMNAAKSLVARSRDGLRSRSMAASAIPGRSLSIVDAISAAERNGIDMRMFAVELDLELPYFGGITQNGAGSLKRSHDGRIILTLGRQALSSEGSAVNTIAHELNHVREILRRFLR